MRVCPNVSSSKQSFAAARSCCRTHSSKIGSGKHGSSAKSCFRRTCLEWYGFIAVLWSLYLLENSTSGVHSHDNQRARQRHKHKQSRNARGGALAAHHLAWVGHHTGGSSSTPTVHPCLVRQGRCRWLTALSTPKIVSTLPPRSVQQGKASPRVYALVTMFFRQSFLWSNNYRLLLMTP